MTAGLTALIKKPLRFALRLTYPLALALLYPFNLYLARARAHVRHADSVLHVSHLVHVPFHMTRLLRRFGIKADYLAIGSNPLWSQCDYRAAASRWPFVLALREFALLWKVVAKYEVLHLHFAIPTTTSGWELPILKRMGRKIVVHYRGCEIRDREKNMALHPEINICSRCDYSPYACRLPVNALRRSLSRSFGDRFLVTTPDMKDFVPDAEHLPFLAPEIEQAPSAPAGDDSRKSFRIVHVTVHPGIEGTDEIAAAVDNLKRKGHPIEFVFLKGVPHERVFSEYRNADLAIGKMKMGYYANAQIESMTLGVPTVTCVRPEFMTEELRSAGFIFCSLPDLERTLEHYIMHPEELAQKRRIARESVLRLHDNNAIAARLIRIYRDVRNETGR